jgi:hypothetical protein
MTARRMNREARRALSARARDVALQLSRVAMDYNAAGQVVRVNHPRAQAALAKAYERLLRANGAPQVMRVSDDTAKAFPRAGQRPQADAGAWLAVGLDRAGLASYVLRWLPGAVLDPVVERALAEAMLLSALAVECARPGFPAAGNA